MLLRQPEIEDGDQGAEKYERFESVIAEVEVEQDGPVRAVVRIDGKHRKGSRSWLPFSVRLYFYAGAESFRMVHTITFDGTQEPGQGQWRLHPWHRRPVQGADARRRVRPAHPYRRRGHRSAARGREGRHRSAPGPGHGRADRPVRGQETARPVDLGPAGDDQPPVHPRVGRLHPLAALRGRLHGPQADQEGPWLDRRGRRPAGERLRLRRRCERRTRLRAAGLLGEVPRPARHPRRPDRRGRGHHVALVARVTAHGPALLPRRHGPGHLPRTARRPQHHLRGLRARVRHPLRHRPHQRTPLLGPRVDAEHRGDGRAGGRRSHSGSARRAAQAPHQGGRLRQAVLRTGPHHRRQGEDRGPPRLPLHLLQGPGGDAPLVRLLGLRRHHALATTRAGTSGATTSAATPGTTPSSRPTCGSGSRTCAPAAPTSSASRRP